MDEGVKLWKLLEDAELDVDELEGALDEEVEDDETDVELHVEKLDDQGGVDEKVLVSLEVVQLGVYETHGDVDVGKLVGIGSSPTMTMLMMI